MLNNLRKNHRQQVREAHRNALQHRLLHRLEMAQSQGNQDLIRQLQEEAHYLNLKM